MSPLLRRVLSLLLTAFLGLTLVQIRSPFGRVAAAAENRECDEEDQEIEEGKVKPSLEVILGRRLLPGATPRVSRAVALTLHLHHDQFVALGHAPLPLPLQRLPKRQI